MRECDGRGRRQKRRERDGAREKERKREGVSARGRAREQQRERERESERVCVCTRGGARKQEDEKQGLLMLSLARPPTFLSFSSLPLLFLDCRPPHPLPLSHTFALSFARLPAYPAPPRSHTISHRLSLSHHLASLSRSPHTCDPSLSLSHPPRPLSPYLFALSPSTIPTTISHLIRRIFYYRPGTARTYSLGKLMHNIRL